MSTFKEIITRVDEIKPNAFSDATKLNWLTSLNGKLAIDIFLMDIAEARELPHGAEAIDKEPLIGFPHEEVYDEYLAAKIDAANGEAGEYQNRMQIYDAYYTNFVSWFKATYDPVQGDPNCHGLKPKLPTYYITAYGLARMKGFTGTIEEWLASLKGEPGVSPTVTMVPIEGGHRITFEDAEGIHSLDVMDGAGNVSSVCGVLPDQTGNVPLNAEKVGARPDNWTPTAADVGARPDNWTPSADDVKALPTAGGDMTGPINMNGQALRGLNAPTADDQAVNWGSVKEWGKAKAGFIYPLAASVVPEGFLLCDGAAYSRTEYPELFAAIGTMYGSGDGSTTFNVPDITFADGVGAIIATGKGTGVSVSDIIMGAQAFPLGIPYGGTGAGDAKTARENLEITPENIGAARPPELLWENASPESSFAAQTIALDLSSFDFVKIVFKRAYTNTPDIWTMCEVGRICTLQAVADNNSGIWSCVRTATVSKDGIQFSAGTIASFETAAFTRTATNYTIPLIIYGIKGVSA